MAMETSTPYVLVHGFADSADTWGQLIPHLTDGTAHAWDLPGHGERSDIPGTRDHTVAELVDRIAALPAAVALVGHSLGGYLALMVAIDHPDLVASLTLISSGPGFRNSAARATWNDYIDTVATNSGLPEATAAMAHQPDSYVIDHLASVRSPLTQVLGSRDVRYRAGADYVQKVLPGSDLIVIDGAGHNPQRSHPADVAAAIHARRE